MRPFRATYTPARAVTDSAGDPYFTPDTDKSRQVLVLQIVAQTDDFASAVFIDSDNTLKEDLITRFTDCQSDEWRY